MSKALKIVLIILTVLLLLGGTVAVLFNHYVGKMNLTEEETEVSTDAIVAAAEKTDIALPTEAMQEDNGIVNILLLGTDFKIPNSDDPGRADCTMICSVNKGTGSVKLISIERGIYVPLPEGYGYWWQDQDLITHVYHWGGANLSESIVRQCFNINLAGYAQVDFDGFRNVIDAIGGVDIALTDSEASRTQSAQYYNAETGLYHLDGQHALNFARLRSIDSDWSRIERQRKVIAAALDKLKKLPVSEFNALADTVLPLINTNLSKAEIAALLLAAPKVLKNLSVEQMTVPDYNWQNNYIKCDFDYESKKISNFIYDTGYEIECPY